MKKRVQMNPQLDAKGVIGIAKKETIEERVERLERKTIYDSERIEKLETLNLELIDKISRLAKAVRRSLEALSKEVTLSEDNE